MSLVVSRFYPDQVAAFILGKRSVMLVLSISLTLSAGRRGCDQVVSSQSFELVGNGHTT